MQAGRGIPYREVMAETLARLADDRRPGRPRRRGGRARRVAARLAGLRRGATPRSPRCANAGWRLAILSNTDPDLLDASLDDDRRAGRPAVVASEVGSYKPAHRHWESFFARTGADRARHVHVAASLFHDVEPCAQLGLRCVWINRLGERSALPRSAELLDLAALPDTLEALVPA